MKLYHCFYIVSLKLAIKNTPDKENKVRPHILILKAKYAIPTIKHLLFYIK